MTKQQFIESLERDNLTKEEKIETCQYFIDEYPVNAILVGWTKINGVTITGGSDRAVNFAYEQLKKHIDKFKNEK
jgi:hypothetical protein